MIEGIAAVIPGIAMGIKLDKCDRAVLFGMGTDQRIRDKMIAAKGQHFRISGKNTAGMVADGLGNACGIMRVSAQSP